jgi:hypothetical protein
VMTARCCMPEFLLERMAGREHIHVRSTWPMSARE